MQYLRYNIGGSAAGVPGNVGRVRQDGWLAWAEREVIPQMREYDCHRVIIHNPCGVWPQYGAQVNRFVGPPADRQPLATHFEQWEIASLRAPWLSQAGDFAAACNALRAAGATQIIVYIGSPHRLDAWEWDSWGTAHDPPLAWRHVQPFVEAGCDIGLDSTGEYAQTSAVGRLIQRIESHGLKVYHEPWPKASGTWMFNRGFICDHDFFLTLPRGPWATIPQVRGQVIHYLDRGQVTDEIKAEIEALGHDWAWVPTMVRP